MSVSNSASDPVIAARIISSFEPKYRYIKPADTPASVRMSSIDVRSTPERVKQRRAASTKRSSWAFRWSSVTLGMASAYINE